jgi:hypothetical protein
LLGEGAIGLFDALGQLDMLATDLAQHEPHVATRNGRREYTLDAFP